MKKTFKGPTLRDCYDKAYAYVRRTWPNLTEDEYPNAWLVENGYVKAGTPTGKTFDGDKFAKDSLVRVDVDKLQRVATNQRIHEEQDR